MAKKDIRCICRSGDSNSVLKGCKELEIDIVKVIKYKSTCEICRPFNGKIYSISGKSKKYPKLQSIPPFHDKCKHILLPQPRLDDLEEEDDATKNQKGCSGCGCGLSLFLAGIILTIAFW